MLWMLQGAAIGNTSATLGTACALAILLLLAQARVRWGIVEWSGPVALADLDHDGIQDVYAPQKGTNPLAVWFSGRDWKQADIGYPPTGFPYQDSAVDDIDGDGDPDIYLIGSQFIWYELKFELYSNE